MDERTNEGGGSAAARSGGGRLARRRCTLLAGATAAGTGIALMATIAGGCGDGDDGGSAAAPRSWDEVREAELTAPQQAAVERGLEARDAMFTSLFDRLGEAMAEGGPAVAIEVCRDDAPRIGREVGEAHGVRIGRTSFKLRNQDNVPPSWVEPAVLARRETPGRFVAPDGTVGVIEPIRIMQTCLACHGPADQLAPGVAEAVAESYPADRAVGFAEGDLRGWFWIEVPPDAGEASG